MSYQILAAQQLIKGKGISLAEIPYNDLSSIIDIPLNQWPPGFTLLYSPFYLATSENYLLAAMLFSITCAFLLLLLGRAILQLQKTPVYAINLFTLTSGFFGYYFYTKPCTDSIGITFFVAGIYFMLRFIQNNKNHFGNWLGLILSLLLAGFIKYMFIPALFVIPAYMTYIGFRSSNRSLIWGGCGATFLLGLVFLLYLAMQHSHTGYWGFIKQPERGFYPENLKAFFPFLAAAFLKPESLHFLSIGADEPGGTIYMIFQFLTISGCIILVRFLLRKWKLPPSDPTGVKAHFKRIALLVSSAVIFLLLALSVTVGKESTDAGSFWTYAEEPRYYGLITVLIHISLFSLYAFAPTLRKKGRYLLLLPLLLMLPETFHGVFFSAKRLFYLGTEPYGWQTELVFQKKAKEIAEKILSKGEKRKVILAGSSDWFVIRASLYSHIPFFREAPMLNDIEQLKTSEPVRVLAIIRNDQLGEYDRFISITGTQKIDEAAGFSFFTIDLNPK